MVGLGTRSRLPGLLASSGQERPRATYGTDLVTALLGVWFTVGLMVDAWAHNNIPKLETFFTPWHALFYSGFTASAAWILWTVWRQARTGRRGLAAVPVGYGLAVVGVPAFAVAGAGDYLWHSIFGIEQTINILFSPTHLALVTSMIFILTAPLRSAMSDPALPKAPSLGRLVPAVVSLAFTTSLVLLFLQYANAMVYSPEGIVRSFSSENDYGDAAQLAASIAVTALVLVASPLLLARRLRLPFGTVTIVHVAVAGLSGAITGFHNVPVVVTLVVAGVCADLLAVLLRPGVDRRVAYWAFAGLVPLVTWALYFWVASLIVGHVPTVVELWTGAPVVAAMLGLLLGALMLPPRGPATGAVAATPEGS